MLFISVLLHDPCYLSLLTIRSSFFAKFHRTFDFDVPLSQCTLQSSIRRTTEAGEDTYYGRSELVGWTENREPNNLEDLDGFGAEKPVPTSEVKPEQNQQSKLSKNKNKQSTSLEIEEGQINSEGMRNKDASQMNASSKDNRVVEKLDEERIKEIMVKMERRKERFKEAIIMSKGGEKSFSTQNVESDSGEARVVRPARKRRWLGS